MQGEPRRVCGGTGQPASVQISCIGKANQLLDESASSRCRAPKTPISHPAANQVRSGRKMGIGILMRYKRVSKNRNIPSPHMNTPQAHTYCVLLRF